MTHDVGDDGYVSGVNTNDAMRSRILDGALKALALYGSRRFSISAVSELAQISRGTIYRYFSTKEQLLSALIAHLGSDFRDHMRRRLRDEADPRHRVHAVVNAMWEYVDLTPILTQLLEAEPGFVKSFYDQQFHDLVRLVAGTIAPPSERKSAPTPDQLLAAELMVRIAMSYRIVGRDAGELAPQAFSDGCAELLLGSSGMMSEARSASDATSPN